MPALLAPPRRGDPPGEDSLDDGDRSGIERAGVDGRFRAKPRLDFGRHMRQRPFGFARAARKPIEGPGVEPLLAETGEERAQTGPRKARVGVRRVVDERRAARMGEGDKITLLNPMSGRAIMTPSRAVILSMPRSPATPDPRRRRKSTVSA